MLHGDSLWELFEKRVDATPDALMVVDEDMRTLTFAEFWVETERAAAGLRSMGVGKGDVVSWQLPTWIESMVLSVALRRIGAVQNPILPIYRERELTQMTRLAGSTLLVVPSTWKNFNYEAMATTVARENSVVRVLVTDRALPQGDPSILDDLPRIPSDIAESGEEPDWLFFTSGTTGGPKGVLHSDGSLMAAASGMTKRLGLIERDRNSLVFPITHIGGMIWMIAGFQSGCANILMESFDPIETIEVLSREGVTLAGSGTVFHQAYVAAQRKSLHPIFQDVRGFPGGGAPKSPALFDDVRALFGVPILSGYGMTEAPIVTMADLSDSDHDLAHSEGRPQNGVEVRIVDSFGQIAPQGQPGEIRLRAPQMMLGYLNPVDNLDAFDDYGYFRTGDLGLINESGNVVITGRAKDVIIRKGENVSAKDLEDHLAASELIDDVAVIGLPDPDTGERICAVIQPSKAGAGITLDHVTEFLLTRGVITRNLPEQIEVVGFIPRNQSGKILKDLLVDEFKGSAPFA
ncbi:MAG: AMP-binding protein [Microthrixaceae bacterium]